MATDPFDRLREPAIPAEPRPEFAAQLRRRIAEALGLGADPTGGPMAPSHLYYFTIPTPDAERAAAFYGELLGWQLERGSAGGYHIANITPPGGISPSEETQPSVWLTVDGIDAAAERVRAAGGEADEPVEYASGWAVSCRDDQGTHFELSVPIPEYDTEPVSGSRPGELFYVSIPAADPERGRRFYAAVCGWEFGEPGSAGGMHVSNVVPDCGLGGGRSGDHPELWFRVADLDAAAAKVVELGGTVGDRSQGDEGRHLVCADDQGIAFNLSEPASGY
ncbi:MAG: hypothetical protein JWN46_4050 [Acidimicrobiales bacterium]|nr:hypothetical protein [Acidimicrobiales bacterium]